MTKSTDTKNIKIIVSKILSSNGIDNLKLEIDLVEAFKRYVFERDDGESPAEARARVTAEFDKIGEILRINGLGAERVAMQKRVEAALGRNLNWTDLKQDWDGFDLWLIEQEKRGETIERFIAWFKQDEFRARGVIYLNSQKIKDWWYQVFPPENARPIAKPEADGGYR